MTSRVASAAAGLLLALGLATATLAAVRQPLSLGDYLAIWGLKARAIEATGELASVFRVDPGDASSHPEYPPLWPLVLAGTARLLGRYDELGLTLLRPLMLALACGAAFRVTRAPLAARLWAAAAVSLLPYWRSPLHAGYAEGLLVALLLAAAAAAPAALRHGAALLPLARLGLLLALAALTKQEGAVAGLAAAAAFLAARERRAAVAALAGVAAALVPWGLFRALHDPSRPLADFALGAFSPAAAVTAAITLARESLPAAALWVAGGALLLVLAPATRSARRGLLLAAGLYAAALAGAFAFTTRDPAWLVRWTWDRLAFVPAALLLPVLAEAASEALAPASPAPEP